MKSKMYTRKNRENMIKLHFKFIPFIRFRLTMCGISGIDLIATTYIVIYKSMLYNAEL